MWVESRPGWALRWGTSSRCLALRCWRRTRTGKDSEENATKADFTVPPAFLPLISQVGLHLILGRSSAHMWPSSHWPAEDPAVLGPGKPRGQLGGAPRETARGFPVSSGAAHVPQMAPGSQVGRGQRARGQEEAGGGSVSVRFDQSGFASSRQVIVLSDVRTLSFLK